MVKYTEMEFWKRSKFGEEQYFAFDYIEWKLFRKHPDGNPYSRVGCVGLEYKRGLDKIIISLCVLSVVAEAFDDTT